MVRLFIPVCLVLAMMSCQAEPEGAPVDQRLAARIGAKADDGRKSAASWIWRSAELSDGEKVFFRREFELPPDVASASVTIVCDNWHRLWVNGRDLGMGGEWTLPRTYDALASINPGGRNVIAVEGRNESGPAGMALRFRATLKNGKKLHVVSDANWFCNREAPEAWQSLDFPAASAWSKAVVVAKMGEAPWLAILPPEVVGGAAKGEMTDYQVAAGFRLERIYQVPAGQGSWVAMTVDGAGRLLCSDQYGRIYRVTPPADAEGQVLAEPLEIPLQGAHGLLWHQGVLWVTVNEGSDQSGIWRVTDSNGDGEPDKPELVKAIQGRGEHGPHALVAAPDGKSIYLVAGNFTDPPAFDSSLVSTRWAEDQLLPRRPDARGHARDRMAPGGWIARFTPDGKNFQLYASGFRNAYDIAFNDRGDLFTFDSDMEWDLGTPWYRPTRICQVVPGAEFGWRNGSGPWPPYYEDSMPPTLEIGPGSPTGMVNGAGAKFPAKYQRAIFALDWTFATLYAIHLTPDGGGYRAEREEFVSGTGLPLTDAVIGKDGALYFLTGGRRADSALWRVTYHGSESTEPAPKSEPPAAETATSITHDRALLQAVVAGSDSADGKIDPLWTRLGSPDRLQRYGSRLVLEQIPVASWISRLDGESDPWRVISATLAAARTGSKEQFPIALSALDRLDWAKLDPQQQLNWLRAAGLIFARGGPPDEAARGKILAKIDAAFPAKDDFLNRELCRMLSYLEAPGIVARTLTLMDTAGPSESPDWLPLAQRNAHYGKVVEQMIANLPPAQVIHYVYCLRVVKGPWHGDERKRFFAWLAKLAANSGGASYAGFITDLRKQTLATCTPEEREWIEKLETAAPPNSFANLPQIKGPGREWTIDEVVKLAETGLEGRDIPRGKDLYRASLCAACHRFGNEGGSAGPDLSSLSGRFAVRDIAEAILDPGKVISDQYAFDLITRKDGTQVTGKIIEEKDEKWIIATSPFDFTQTTEIEGNDIQDIKPSPVSPMPPGLINRLNPEELKDLLAYLLGK